MAEYPHARSSGGLVPIQSFQVGNRVLSLYNLKDRNPNAHMSMYWDDEQSPIQHRMDWLEVLAVIADALAGKSFPEIVKSREGKNA